MVITLLALQSVIFLLIVFGMMYLANRYANWYLATGIGVTAALIIFVLIIDLAIVCNREPIFIPPNSEEIGDIGSMIHACDGPSGFIAHWFIYLTGPLTILICAALVWYFIVRGRAKTSG